jgi:hypothetical protein
MRIAKLAGLLACGVLLGGCANQVVPAAPPAAPTVVLVRVADGGLCRSGAECRSSITFLDDGSWTALGAGSRRAGRLADAELARLTAALATTGLGSAPPATEVCPLAYDGQEIHYTWSSAGAQHEAASCTVAFDPADPLVAAAETLAERIG